MKYTKIIIFVFFIALLTSCPEIFQDICTAQVDFSKFYQSAYQNQQMSQWCWAAGISMIFKYYDHPVSQQRIVYEAYGNIYNMPASNLQIAMLLNRDWIDDNNKRFRARITAAYDYYSRIYALNNPMIIDELENQHPMILAVTSHIVVLTSIEYDCLNRFVIYNAGVFDPWPGRGARTLSPYELLVADNGGGLTFAITISID